MSDDVMKIRRALVRLDVGQTTEIVIPGMSTAAVLAAATDFAKLKKMAIDAKITDTGVAVTRIEPRQRGWINPFIDALEVGQSHYFDVAAPLHQAIRVAASARYRTQGTLFKCTRQGTGLLVTRIPATTEETQPRAGAYQQINTLELGKSHVFAVPLALHHRVRQAASNRGRMHGIAFTCQGQPDGSIKVTRVPATEAETMMCPDIDTQPRSTKWRLERLAVERELRFTLSPADQVRLRTSVAQKAAITGWRIRCRKQDDGTMLVYRTDADATPEPLQPKVPPNYH